MNKKWLKLAGAFLMESSYDYPSHGTWSFPEDWTEEEKREIAKEINDVYGFSEQYDPSDPGELDFPAWLVMSFLADKLNHEAQ